MSKRRTTVDPLIGTQFDLPPLQLPTNGDVLRALQFRRKLLNTKDVLPPVRSFVSSITTSTIEIWVKASIPQLLKKKSIENKLLKLYERYTKALKCVQSNHSPKVVADFKASLDKLFDICSCQCPRTENMSKGKMCCECIPINRVLQEEVEFLFDQRSTRRLVIGSTIDSSTTLKYTKTQTWDLKRMREKSASSEGSGSESESSLPSSGSSSSVLGDRPRPVTYFPDLMVDSDSELETNADETDDDPDYVATLGRYAKKRKETLTAKACADADRRCQSLRAMSDSITNTVIALDQSDQKVQVTAMY